MGFVDGLLTDWLLERLTQFLPIFLRVSTFIGATPIFRRNAPTLTIIGLSALIAWLLWPVTPAPALPLDFGFLLVAIQEVALGLLMGLVVTAFLYAVYLAGQLMDVPMGFGMVNILDPQFGMEVPVMAQFHFVLAVVFFFSIDGHHALLRTLAGSFHAAPVAMLTAARLPVEEIVGAVGAIFLLGVRIALPVMGALFLADVAMGLIARAVPQINVFFVGFPVKTTLGLFLIVLALPSFLVILRLLYDTAGEMFLSLEGVIKAIGPP